MNNQISAYPAPDRSKTIFNQNLQHGHSPERDIGSKQKVMKDGRPVLVEFWIDIDTDLLCGTAWYVTQDIESWSDDDHKQYLVTNGLLTISKDGDFSLGVKRQTDDSGHAVVSCTWVIDDPD